MQAKTNWKYFSFIGLVTFTTFSLFFGLILFFVYQTEKQANETIFCLKGLNEIKLLNQIISNDFNEIVIDLRIISGSSEFNRFINKSGDDIDSIKNDFYNISKQKNIYDQIRYLDKTGQEVVRINYNKGNPIIVPGAQLQNKAKRYYFEDTFKLKPDEIFISPLDLNIEQGKIEQPLKPMIRFGTPVFDTSGGKCGIIVLNYLAGNVLTILEKVASRESGQFSLLNSEGYWLEGPETKDEWGFMYKNRKNITFGNKFPAEWKKISEAASGQFYSPNGLFTFDTFYPLKKSEKSSTGSDSAFGISKAKLEGKGYYFKIVSHVPNSILWKKSQEVFKAHFHFYIS